MPGNHFRSGVTRATTCCLKKLSACACVTQAEIDNFYVEIRIKKEVFRLEISMGDIKRVDILNTGDYLLE